MDRLEFHERTQAANNHAAWMLTVSAALDAEGGRNPTAEEIEHMQEQIKALAGVPVSNA